MATTKTTAGANGDAASSPVSPAVDHDRVAMLSVGKDGTPDQHDPELIGDKDAALAATREQLQQQAVSAVDSAKRAEILDPTGTGSAETLKQDPAIAALGKAQGEAAEAAEKSAEKVVGDLHQG